MPRGIQGRAEHGSNTTVQIRPLGPEVVAGLRRLRGGQLGQVQRLPATAPSASLARPPGSAHLETGERVRAPGAQARAGQLCLQGHQLCLSWAPGREGCPLPGSGQVNTSQRAGPDALCLGLGCPEAE